MHQKIATYRLQLCADFTLNDAATIVDYLSELGVSHVYSSPILQAVKGSTHGYDVLDHTRINCELGGDPALVRLTHKLSQHGLGLLLDIVPNHMAIGKDNHWWWDVLENGQASPYAAYFDVEWHPPESKFRHLILLPVLGDHYGKILDARELRVERQGGTFTVRYHDQVFPLSPRSLTVVLQQAADRVDADQLEFLIDALDQLPSSRTRDEADLRRRHRDKRILLSLLTRFLHEDPTAAAAVDRTIDAMNHDPQALHELLERQNFRLAFWRTAERDLGYRRFFDINTLIGLRTEEANVFDDIHRLLFKWLTPHGPVDGVRVDHPDGLLDPFQYLKRLRDRVHTGWIVVEKILMPDEHLRQSWPVSGTTGYDFLNQVTGLFIDRENEQALTHLYSAFTGDARSFAEVLQEKKRQVLHQIFGSDVNILTSLLLQICERHIHHRDYTRHELHEALQELIVEFPVYRTYIRPTAGHLDPEDEAIVVKALQEARAARPDSNWDLLRFIGDILLMRMTGPLETDFVTRFQQVTGPVMAKSAEDTAFYCYHRFIALNEVGGDPGRFGVALQDFHTWCGRMQVEWPNTMLTTSTHDTKRSDDVRARLVALSEMPEHWSTHITSWTSRHAAYWGTWQPDRNFEYFWYQTLVGTWPLEPERALSYCEKSIREAKIHTSWTNPQLPYEEAVKGFVQSLYDDETFLHELTEFVEELDVYGLATSLSQLLIKLTAPGIPDLYQGSELWNFTLVDPDNRRSVDYELRRHLLQEVLKMTPWDVWQRRREGLPKLWVVQKALHLRRENPRLFGDTGNYIPIHASGPKRDHVIAYLRGGEVLTIAPRWFFKLNGNWHGTEVELPPGQWHNVLDGRRFTTGPCPMKELSDLFPVALLIREVVDYPRDATTSPL